MSTLLGVHGTYNLSKSQTNRLQH